MYVLHRYSCLPELVLNGLRRLLAGPEFRMASEQAVTFAVDPPLGPYLTSFSGSQAERHIENIKVCSPSALAPPEAYIQ